MASERSNHGGQLYSAPAEFFMYRRVSFSECDATLQLEHMSTKDLMSDVSISRAITKKLLRGFRFFITGGTRIILNNSHSKHILSN